MISADALLTKQYATTAAAIGTPCPGHVKWPIVPPSARCAKPAACVATMTVAAFTSIRRDGCERCESVSRCVTVPAIATSIVACGPRSSSEVKSMTKDGGMVAQSFVVDCCIARAEVRIAARIRPENSRVR